MIKQNLRGEIVQIDQIKTSLDVFYLQYDAVPGDMSNFSSYFSGETDGDGDKLIPYGTEHYSAWRHLNLAEVLPGNYTGVVAGSAPNSRPGSNVPQSKIRKNLCFTWEVPSGDYWSQNYGPGKQILNLGSNTYPTATPSHCYAGGMTPTEAHNIDRKTDDGLPSSGNTMSRNDTLNNNSGSQHCYHTSNNVYQVQSSNVDACALFFKIREY